MALSKVVSVNRFPAIRAGMRPKARLVITAAIANIRLRAAQSMEGKESPSSPGTPPAIVSGLLHGSIDTRMIDDLEGVVFTTVEHGAHTELGTIYMEPRPWLDPAVQAEEPAFYAAMGTIFRP